ncbi:hypothetical protein KM043_005712 [Ampulex compressa]|nr:hypothetical protein KM043_005712 [Ampulex compressa]
MRPWPLEDEDGAWRANGDGSEEEEGPEDEVTLFALSKSQQHLPGNLAACQPRKNRLSIHSLHLVIATVSDSRSSFTCEEPEPAAKPPRVTSVFNFSQPLDLGDPRKSPGCVEPSAGRVAG